MKTYVVDKLSPGSSPYYFAVTPSDDAADDFDNLARALYVGTSGDVSVVNERGEAVLFKNVPSGKELPVICRRVTETDTTAEDIVALY